MCEYCLPIIVPASAACYDGLGADLSAVRLMCGDGRGWRTARE